MKKFGWIFALVMVMGLGFAAFSLSATASKQVFKPGESGSISIAVSNSATDGRITAANIEVTGAPGFVYTQNLQIGELNHGSSTTLTIPLTINADTPSGVYVFKIKAQGSEIFSDSSTTYTYNEASVPIYVLNKPIIIVGGYNSNYNEGSVLNLTLSNRGGAMKSARLSVLADFALVGANEIYLGDVTDSKSVALQLDVSGMSEGQNTLHLMLVYNDELGNEVNETKDVALTVKKQTPDVSFLQDSKITSNQDNSVTFNVVNGNKALTNVKLAFADAGIIIKGNSEIKIGDLAPGETKRVTFTMHPDISPGTVNENATLTYTDSGKELSERITIALTVDSDSDVQVYLDAKPLPLVDGQEETLTVTVANTWDYPIDSTSVKISGDFYDLLSVQNEQYIGLLNKDDFSSVQFKIKVKEGAGPQGNLTVTIKYKDAFGSFVEKQKQLVVDVAQKPAAEGLGLAPIIAVIAVLAAVYWFFLRKKPQASA